jgi:hypothetical protein
MRALFVFFILLPAVSLAINRASEIPATLFPPRSCGYRPSIWRRLPGAAGIPARGRAAAHRPSASPACRSRLSERAGANNFTLQQILVDIILLPAPHIPQANPRTISGFVLSDIATNDLAGVYLPVLIVQQDDIFIFLCPIGRG